MKRKRLHRLLRNFRKSEKKGRVLIERAIARGDYRWASGVAEQNKMLAKVIEAVKEELKD